MIDSMFVFYPITLAPNGIKESLAILKNCLPNGIPTIVMHQIQPTIRFPSAISIHDFFSKRPECQRCKFKALQTYRNSNNCNTPYASCKNPCKSAEHASKYKPQNISQSSHIRISPDAIPDTASYPLFCEQFAASIASTSNNAGISLLGLSYSMTYVSPQLRSFLCTWTTALQASYTS